MVLCYVVGTVKPHVLDCNLCFNALLVSSSVLFVIDNGLDCYLESLCLRVLYLKSSVMNTLEQRDDYLCLWYSK